MIITKNENTDNELIIIEVKNLLLPLYLFCISYNLMLTSSFDILYILGLTGTWGQIVMTSYDVYPL